MAAILEKNVIFHHFSEKKREIPENWPNKWGKSFPRKVAKMDLKYFLGKLFPYFWVIFLEFRVFWRHMAKNGPKSHFWLKLPPFWAKKMGKTKNFKNLRGTKFYLLGTLFFQILGSIWPFLKKKIGFSRFSDFLRFSAKNRNFFTFLPMTRRKMKFLKKIFFYWILTIKLYIYI